MDPIRFSTTIRYWNPERGSGLAVADIPGEHIADLGGLKQQRIHGSVNGTAFTSNVMPAGGGRMAVSVSKAMMAAAGIGVGDTVEVEITNVGA